MKKIPIVYVPVDDKSLSWPISQKLTGKMYWAVGNGLMKMKFEKKLTRLTFFKFHVLNFVIFLALKS